MSVSRCPFLELSDELYSLIFSYLEPSELFRLSLVCRNLYVCLRNDWIWQKAFLARFNRNPVKRIDETCWKREYTKRLTNLMVFKKGRYKTRSTYLNCDVITCLESISTNGQIIVGSETSGSFTTFDIGNNGLMQICDSQLSEQTKEEKISSLSFRSNVCVCGYDQGHILKFDFKFGSARKMTHFHNSHRKSVSAIDTNGIWLISGDNDGVLMVSGTKRNSCYVIQAHESAITALCLSENEFVASATADGEICLWKLSEDQGFLLRTWRGHQSAISCMQMESSGLFTLALSRDGTLKLWSAEKDTFYRSFEGSSAYVSCFSWDSTCILLIYGLNDGKIKIWEGDFLKDYQLVKTLYDSDSPIVNIRHDAWKLVSLNGEGCIKIWDILGGECLLSLDFGKYPLIRKNMPEDNILNDWLRAHSCLFTSCFQIILAIESSLICWDFAPKRPFKAAYKGKNATLSGSSKESKGRLEDFRDEMKTAQTLIEMDRQMDEKWDRLCMKNNLSGLSEEELVQYATMLSLEPGS